MLSDGLLRMHYGLGNLVVGAIAGGLFGLNIYEKY